MWYLGSLLIATTMLFAVAVVGLRICDLLPYRFRPVGRSYFSPILGLAAFVLIATLNGWLSPFKQWICVVTAIPLIGACFYFEPNKRVLLPYFFKLFIFILIASSTVFFPILRFDAYNPFNDTFTYLVHGQWLQEYAFSEPAISSGFYPALTQVSLYQGAGHRMGASFFLGWVQAAFNIEWSYYVYPSVVVLPLVAGALAVGGAVKFVVRRSQVIAVLTALASATMLNGFSFGAIFGFFPQTFGLAFAVASFTLIGALTAQLPRIRESSKIFLSLLPASLCLSAFAFTYSDFMAICLAALAGYLFVIALFRYVERKKVLLLALFTTIQTVLLINYEFVRIIKNFMQTVLGVASGHATIGWPVLWNPVEFVAHALGFKSPLDGIWIFGFKAISLFVVGCCLIIVACYFFTHIKKDSLIFFLPHIFIVSLLVFAFVYFRFFSEPPRPSETGNTFLQFKVAKWASPFCVVMLGISLAYLSNTRKMLSKIIMLFLGVIVLNSVIINYATAKHFTNGFLSETGYKRSSFSSLLRLRELTKDIPSNQIIYLNLGAAHNKLRQMAAYILFDRKLFSDFSDDCYIFGHLPSDQRSPPFDLSDWTIDYVQANEIASKKHLWAGNLVIKKRPRSLIKLVSVTGGHQRESDGYGWWYWTPNSLEFKYKILGTIIRKIRFKFSYMPIGNERNVKIVINSKKNVIIRLKLMKGWHEYVSSPIEVGVSGITVTFVSDGKPIPISGTDSRLAKFLIKNLEIVPVE